MHQNNDYKHALSIDNHDANNKWTEVIKLGVDQQHDCDTQKNVGKGSSPKGHENVRSHFIFDAKYYGHHKPRL